MQQVTVWLRYTRILMTLVKNYCSDYYNVESSGDLANTLDCLAGSEAQLFVTQFCKSPTENHISLIMLRLSQYWPLMLGLPVTVGLYALPKRGPKYDFQVGGTPFLPKPTHPWRLVDFHL